jgi:hypothetical protein
MPINKKRIVDYVIHGLGLKRFHKMYKVEEKVFCKGRQQDMSFNQ